MSSKIATVALVTGANKGIGKCIVESIAKKRPDVHVLLGCRDPKSGENALNQMQPTPKNVSILQIDVTDQKSIDSAAANIRDNYGGLDILVNNAGIAYKGIWELCFQS